MFFKIILFIFESVLAILALILPNDVPKKSVQFADEGILSGLFYYFYKPGNIFAFILIFLWYIAATLYQFRYYPDTPANEKLSEWSNLDLIVLSLMFFGTMLRIFCYKTFDLIFAHELNARRGKKLVTTGPYAYVKHPLHTGYVLMVLGRIYLAWRSKNWYPSLIQKYFWPLVITDLVLMSIGLHSVIKAEEVTLARKYGRQWEEYAKKTRRFIPKFI